MSKRQISYIRNVITEYGNFSICEVENEESPIFKTLSKDNVQLIEAFNSYGVKVTTYVHETVVSEDVIPYENLNRNILSEVCRIVENYEAEQIQTNKRCSSY